MNYFIKSKVITLTTGRILSVRRSGIGHLFMLLYLISMTNTINNKSYKNMNIEEIHDYISELTDLNDNIKNELQQFISCSMDELSIPEIKETITVVLDFNSPELLKNNEQNVKSRRGNDNDIEEYFIKIVSDLIKYTGWTVEYISENINYVQALSLIDGFKQCRAESIIDMAAATRGDIVERIDTLTGYKRCSLSEFSRQMQSKETH